MATYYVSWDHGSDSNNGLGPDASHATNKPWKTLEKALGASGISSGDTVHISPGTQREVVSVVMTSATAETFVLGDPLNLQGFKDSGGVLVVPGEVRWSAYTTNDTSAPGASCLTLSGRDYLTLQDIVFVPGSSSAILGNAASSTNIKLKRICILPSSAHGTGFGLIIITGTADTALDWSIEDCIFFNFNEASVSVILPTSAVADYDASILIQNCRFFGGHSRFIYVNASGANAFFGGGVGVLNCTFMGRPIFGVDVATNISQTYPCTVYNSVLILGGATALNAGTGTGRLVEDYNLIHCTTARANVSIGANSITSNYATLWNVDQSALFGFLPRLFLEPSKSSPALGFGSTGAPSTDATSRLRPSGGESTSNAVGALERHDFGTLETTVTDAGSTSIKLTGPGDHDFRIPVDASSTTITIKVRYDTNHAATNKPQVILLDAPEIGVTTETKTATAAVDTWETLTFSAFTPSAKGWVVLRLVSRAAAGNGIAYFDTITKS